MRFDCAKAAMVCLALGFLAACGGGGGGSNASATTSSSSSSVPQNVKASVDNSGNVLVTWEAPADGADSYGVQAQVAQGTFTTVTPAPISATGHYMSFTTTAASLGAAELTEVGFRVLAYKGSAQAVSSATATAKVPLRAPEITLTTASDGIQRLTIINHSAVADQLQLFRSASFDLNLLVWDTVTLGTLPVGTASYVDDTPPEGSTVYYTVQYSKGTDTVSGTSNQCPAAYRPPSGLTATVSGQVVTLTWVNHSAAATTIEVLRGGGLGASSLGDFVALQPGVQSFVDTLPAPGFYSYALQVRTKLWSSVSTDPALIVALPPANGLSLTSSILQMPIGRQALRGDSGKWYFAQELHDGHPTIYLPAGTAWNATTPTPSGQLVDPYLALDPLEIPHAVFLEGLPSAGPQTILHGWWDGASWQREEVAQRVINTSLAPGITWCLDHAGVAHVLWAEGDYTQPQALEYASRNPDGSWAIESVTMPPPAQQFHAIQFQMFVDDAGTPHLLLQDIFTIYHVVRTGPGTWTWENLGDLGQGYFQLAAEAGFGSGPSDFTLFLKRNIPGSANAECCLLSKVAGSWQAPVSITGGVYSGAFTHWARSRTDGRMAFYFPAPDGTKLVVGANGAWTSYILNPEPSQDAFPAFDPLGRLHLLCQVSQQSIGSQVVAVNVLYDEVPAAPSARR